MFPLTSTAQLLIWQDSSKDEVNGSACLAILAWVRIFIWDFPPWSRTLVAPQNLQISMLFSAESAQICFQLAAWKIWVKMWTFGSCESSQSQNCNFHFTWLLWVPHATHGWSWKSLNKWGRLWAKKFEWKSLNFALPITRSVSRWGDTLRLTHSQTPVLTSFT